MVSITLRFIVQLLTEMLMGKRVEITLACSAYSRGISGEQSPLDLETTFQLLYRLFTHTVKPEDGDLRTCLKYAQRFPSAACPADPIECVCQH